MCLSTGSLRKSPHLCVPLLHLQTREGVISTTASRVFVTLPAFLVQKGGTIQHYYRWCCYFSQTGLNLSFNCFAIRLALHSISWKLIFGVSFHFICSIKCITKLLSASSERWRWNLHLREVSNESPAAVFADGGSCSSVAASLHVRVQDWHLRISNDFLFLACDSGDLSFLLIFTIILETSDGRISLAVPAPFCHRHAMVHKHMPLS